MPLSYQQNLARLRSGMVIDATASVVTGQAYLTSELSVLDPVVRLPLQNSTWRRDIPLQLGGGWIDNEVVRYVDFRAPKDEVPGTQSNDIRVVSYNRTQDVFPVMPFESRVRIPLIEGLKMAQIGQSPDDLLNKGVRLDWEQSANKRAYQGINGYPGLCNNPQIVSYALPNTGTGSSSQWSNKTPAQILADFNFIATTISNASGNATVAFPNRFLVPFGLFPVLTQLMTVGAVGGGESVMGYVKRNYFGASFGVTPEIYPLPYWLDNAGIGGTSQIVAYNYNEDNISMRLAEDLQPFGGPLSVVSGAYEKLYAANLGIVKFLRPYTVGYFYGG